MPYIINNDIDTKRQIFCIWHDIMAMGDIMKVKVFDEAHEKDLERVINDFLEDDVDIIDIKFDVSASIYSEEQIYCFSALVMYKEKDSQL